MSFGVNFSKPIAVSKLAASYVITGANMNFMNEPYCMFHLVLRDEQGNDIGGRMVDFTAEELSDWGEDDTILFEKINAKLEQ